MENRIYGYARVSSREQNTDRQIEALTRFGVPEQQIIIDRASGKDTEREGYQYLKRQILRRGDTLVIKELDRLSRNKDHIHDLRTVSVFPRSYGQCSLVCRILQHCLPTASL